MFDICEHNEIISSCRYVGCVYNFNSRIAQWLNRRIDYYWHVIRLMTPVINHDSDFSYN